MKKKYIFTGGVLFSLLCLILKKCRGNIIYYYNLNKIINDTRFIHETEMKHKTNSKEELVKSLEYLNGLKKVFVKNDIKSFKNINEFFININFLEEEFLFFLSNDEKFSSIKMVAEKLSDIEKINENDFEIIFVNTNENLSSDISNKLKEIEQLNTKKLNILKNYKSRLNDANNLSNDLEIMLKIASKDSDYIMVLNEIVNSLVKLTEMYVNKYHVLMEKLTQIKDESIINQFNNFNFLKKLFYKNKDKVHFDLLTFEDKGTYYKTVICFRIISRIMSYQILDSNGVINEKMLKSLNDYLECIDNF